MTLRAEEAEAELIDGVCRRARGQIGSSAADRCEAFVRQFYHRVPLEDLAGRSAHDLYGAAMAIWQFAGVRAPGCSSVRAYNPVAEEHGWRSSNTIVEVLTDYMPFLVDWLGWSSPAADTGSDCRSCR